MGLYYEVIQKNPTLYKDYNSLYSIKLFSCLQPQFPTLLIVTFCDWYTKLVIIFVCENAFFVQKWCIAMFQLTTAGSYIKSNHSNLLMTIKPLSLLCVSWSQDNKWPEVFLYSYTGENCMGFYQIQLCFFHMRLMYI